MGLEMKVKRAVLRELANIKLVSKERIGSRTTKKHDVPKTAYQRLLESPEINPGAEEPAAPGLPGAECGEVKDRNREAEG